MYPDIDYGLVRERRVQVHEEVEHDRLRARLARVARSEEGNATRNKGRVSRSVALVAALLR